MNANNIKFIISGIILLAMAITTSAQESTTMFHMRGLPQSTSYNPALHNDSSAVVVGLPGLSGVYVGMNSDFAINDLIHYGTGSLADSLVVDINRFHNAIKDHNVFRQNSEISLFYLGFRTRKVFISFGVADKQSAQFSFDKEFITFLKDGNAAAMGQEQDLGDLSFNAFHYREFALGASHELMAGKLSVGAKVKALYGKFALQTNKLNFKVKTAADASSVLLTTDMDLNLSAPVVPEYDENDLFDSFEDGFDFGDYILNTDNMGVAFDLGAVFKATPKITVSASIIDVGKIPFKTDVFNVKHYDSYNWEGLDFSNSFDDTDPDYISAGDLVDNEIDKLEAVIKPKRSEVTSNSFDLSVPTKIFLGGTYQMNNKLNFGLLDRIYMYEGETMNSVTLSANAALSKFFSVSGSYSAISNTYDNLGLGFSVQLGFFQLYMVNDNMLALFNPSQAEFVNFRFGMNFLFGRNYSQYVH